MTNKISIPFSFYLLLLIIFLTAPVCLISAQDSTNNRLKVTHNKKEYRKQVLHDAAKRMIELKTLIPGLVYDLRYASKDNFMHRLMYAENTSITFLRQPAAFALQQVQHELAKKGLGLKIFDAYRPYSVTVKFWELVKDERYVANPAKGSGHNRGIAVDLTIVDTATGIQLDMGTDFDNFTDTARSDFAGLPATVLQNRLLLKSTMEKYGFVVLSTEWWHFYLPQSAKFEVLDIDFKKMKIAL
jgi:D-alanyl-D-alanine dipeptidase